MKYIFLNKKIIFWLLCHLPLITKFSVGWVSSCIIFCLGPSGLNLKRPMARFLASRSLYCCRCSASFASITVRSCVCFSFIRWLWRHLITSFARFWTIGMKCQLSKNSGDTTTKQHSFTSEATSSTLSPAEGSSRQPSTDTGVDGGASWTALPSALFSIRTYCNNYRLHHTSKRREFSKRLHCCVCVCVYAIIATLVN